MSCHVYIAFSSDWYWDFSESSNSYEFQKLIRAPEEADVYKYLQSASDGWSDALVSYLTRCPSQGKFVYTGTPYGSHLTFVLLFLLT